MVYKVVWTKRAILNFDKIIEYLVENWTLKVARDFILKVNAVVESIRTFPRI